ncbi:RNase H domain-containing protein [Trichonephila clavipes]|nr:RNase H domain-containing protein [Trichonephila clavipes]
MAKLFICYQRKIEKSLKVELSNQKSRPTYLSWSNLRSRTPLFKAHRTNCQQSSWKTEYPSKTKRNFLGGSRPQTLKSTFCTVIRPVLEYATPIWTTASISVKRKRDSVQHRAAKIIIGAVSSTNNGKAEQECALPPLERRRNLATIKFTNKLRSFDLNHISRRVFDKWKHSTRLKRSSTLQLDSEIRKELNLEHSSLEFLREPLIPKNPPKNTCFELELLRPCSKKEDPATLRQKGLETIEILSQDNIAITYTDGSSDRSLSNGGTGILLLLPDGNNYKHKIYTGIIASNFTSELMAIREAHILYQQDPHVIDSTEGLVIFSDSKSAIEAIRNGETNISCDIITLLEQLHSKRKSCILQWIPAHVNIKGNECADIASPKKLETSIISAPPSHFTMLTQ